MTMDQTAVGRIYRSDRPYHVGREKIREFVEATGDPNPAYLDVEAAKAFGHPDVIAPPTFAMVVTWPPSLRMFEDPELGMALHRLLHTEQRFAYERPITVGDELDAVLTIASVRTVSGMDMFSTRCEVTALSGELVCTVFGTLFHRPEGMV